MIRSRTARLIAGIVSGVATSVTPPAAVPGPASAATASSGTKARKRRGLGAALVLVTASLLAVATTTAASASPSAPNSCAKIHDKVGKSHIAIMAAAGTCVADHASDVANGTPPLIWHGGAVMGTRATGPVVVTPIFWSPSNYPMAFSYKALLLNYHGAVANSSGHLTNVYSVLTEYFGSNGQIRYQFNPAFPIFDSNPLPASGCTVASQDTFGIYADGSGYSACLDDAQITAEIDRVTAATGLPHNLSHIYVIYLPKHVESCILPGQTTSTANGQACTINYQPTGLYCAYHGEDSTNAIYANMPYPIYGSATGFTCSSEAIFGVTQSPNNNLDGDVQISTASHEISESITDPDTATGWYDSSGFEIGDECAYIFGPVSGVPGRFYNQVISNYRYLTQEEFSNRDFAITGGGCVQNVLQEAG